MGTYNGWRNYETWSLFTWISNSQSLWSYWIERAEAHYVHLDRCLADELEDTITADLEHFELNGLYRDLLTRGFADVDWQSIADAIESAACDV